MSVFDQSFSQPLGCFGICNEKGSRAPIRAFETRVEDDLRTSANREKKREIDDILSRAMNGLSFDERQEQLEILHGVNQRLEEGEDFIEAKLQDLEDQLNQIKSRSVYETAEQMDPAYVSARAFRVMFLRGNRYDTKKTAENMLKFFDFKHQLFGIKKVVKDITLEDLDEDDIAVLKSGFLQIAGKDRSGRLLYLNIPGLRYNGTTVRNELRIRYYMHMSALEDEDMQHSYGIQIAFAVGDMKGRVGGGGLFEHAAVGTVIPDFMAALHLCTDDVKTYLILDTVLKGVPSKLRSRSRLHFGSQTECLYHLSTYGIPKSFLPLDPKTNQVCLKRHLQWVESRFAKEKYSRPSPIITLKEQKTGSCISPCDYDVLVGTGTKSNNMGNQRLRAHVKELAQVYGDGSKEERKALVDWVIASIHESGGRFLKEHNVDGWNVVWNEMSRDQIRNIVTQAFRNNYRRR